MRWLVEGWRLLWRLFPVLSPFAALFSAWQLLELKLGSDISLVSLILDLIRFEFTFPLPQGLSPWHQALFLFGKIVVIPLLWFLALYLGFLKLQGRKLSCGLWIFLARLPDLVRACLYLSLVVLLGLLLLVIPGIRWGLSLMFGPLIVLVRERYWDAFSASDAITSGHKVRIFFLLLLLVFLDETGRLIAVNLGMYKIQVATAFAVFWKFILQGLAIGSVLATFVELSWNDLAGHYGLPSVGVVLSWDRRSRALGFTVAIALLGVAGYIAGLGIPGLNPLGSKPRLHFLLPSPLSQRADLILGVEGIEAMAPGPSEGEVTLVTASGLEVRTLPDLTLTRFVPLDFPLIPYAVALSPSGEAALTGHKSTVLVRLADGEIVWRREGLVGRTITFSPRGNMVAVGRGNEVTFLEPFTGEEILTIVLESPVWDQSSVINRWSNEPFHDRLRMEYLSFSPRGDLLVVVLDDPYGLYFHYTVLRIPSGEELYGGVGYATFLPSGELAVARDQELYICDPETGEEKFKMQLPEERRFLIRSKPRVAVNSEGDFVISRSSSVCYVNRKRENVSAHPFPAKRYRRPFLFRIGSAEFVIPWVEITHFSWCVGLEKGPIFAGHIALFINCGHLELLDARSGHYMPTVFLAQCSAHHESPMDLDPKGEFLVVAVPRAEVINVYSLPDGTLQDPVPIGIREISATVRLSPEGDMMAVGDMFSELELFSTQQWRKLLEAEEVKGPLGWWRGKILVLQGHYLGLLDPGTGTVETKLIKLHVSDESEWDLGGDKIAVLNQHLNLIRVIDLSTEEERSFPVSDGTLSLDLSPAGDLLAIGFSDGRIEVRSSWNWELLAEFELELGHVREMEFISRRLLACGSRGNLAVIDTETGESIFADRFPGSSVIKIRAAEGYLGVLLSGGPVLVYRLPLR